MPAANLAHMDLHPYDVTWKTVSMGYCKDVNPQSLTPLVRELRVGQYGPLVLDRVHLGLEGAASISLVLHQVDKTVIQQLCPWWSSGTVPLVPGSPYFSEYANAGELILHPQGSGVSTDEDVTILKAFPTFQLPRSNAMEQEWREIAVMFRLYPDQSQLPNRVYGYYGAKPV